MTTTAAGEPVPGSLGELLDVALRHELLPTHDTHRQLMVLSQAIADRPDAWSVIMAMALREAQLSTAGPLRPRRDSRSDPLRD